MTRNTRSTRYTTENPPEMRLDAPDPLLAADRKLLDRRLRERMKRDPDVIFVGTTKMAR